MKNILVGIIIGIVLSTVGFNGLANIGNNAVESVQNFARNNVH